MRKLFSFLILFYLVFFTISCSSAFLGEEDTLLRIQRWAKGKPIYVFCPSDENINGNGYYESYPSGAKDKEKIVASDYYGRYVYIERVVPVGSYQNEYVICFDDGKEYPIHRNVLPREMGEDFSSYEYKKIPLEEWYGDFFLLDEYEELSSAILSMKGMKAFDGTDITIVDCDIHYVYFSCGGRMSTRDYYYKKATIFSLYESSFEDSIREQIITFLLSNNEKLYFDSFDERYTIYSEILRTFFPGQFNIIFSFTSSSVGDLMITFTAPAPDVTSVTLKSGSKTIEIIPDFSIQEAGGYNSTYTTMNIDSSINLVSNFLNECGENEILYRPRSSKDTKPYALRENAGKRLTDIMSLKASLELCFKESAVDILKADYLYSPFDVIINHLSNVSYSLPAGYTAYESLGTVLIDANAGTRISHVMSDIYEAQSDEEKKLYPRSILNNSFFKEEFYSKSFDIPVNEVKKEYIGGNEFYSFAPSTHQVCYCTIHNGYSEMFVCENDVLGIDSIKREIGVLLSTFRFL